MANGIQYTIKQNRYKNAWLRGISCEKDRLILEPDESSHILILKGLDSAVPDCPWGRLMYESTLPEDTVVYLYTFSSNEDSVYYEDGYRTIDSILFEENLTFHQKKEFLQDMGAQRFINKKDVLLYGSKGRYLWIAVEIIGEGSGEISKMRVNAPGDNFMQTFPEVYQNYGDFFHRYMSVFSSIHNDFQDQIDSTEQLLDLDQAPVELLDTYAQWMGLMLQGQFLSEEALRKLIKDAYFLNKYKGTRQVIERLCEIILGEKPYIYEKNMMSDYIRKENQETCNRLYGSSPYDVTLMISSYVDEKKRAQLLYLLRQFKPVRSILRVIFLQDTGVLDGHSYMDINAKVFTQTLGSLDEHQLLNGTVVLQ